MVSTLFLGHEAIANGEHIKRQRRCDVDTVNTFDQQASKLTSTGIQMLFDPLSNVLLANLIQQ
jgi:hypothetical protein